MTTADMTMRSNVGSAVWGALRKGGLQLGTVVAVFVAGAVLVPGFMELTSLQAMLVIASFLGIAAIGQTLVVLVGGIDLSVPAMVGAGNVIAARLAGDGYPSVAIIVIVLVLGLIVGALNGFITSRWSIPPLVVTIATGSVVGGCILLWTNATLTGSAPVWLTTFTSAASSTGPIPVAPVVVLWIVLGVVAQILIRNTRPGRQIYMLGANRDAARLMLVSERAITVLAFALCSSLAGLTGLLLAGFTGAGLFNVGDPYLFQTIAAVVVGGTSLLGGRGSVGRTILGAITLVALTNVLIGVSLTTAGQQAVLGAVIVLVTALYGRERSVGDRV
jgi:ribose transport system permease protein